MKYIKLSIISVLFTLLTSCNLYELGNVMSSNVTNGLEERGMVNELFESEGDIAREKVIKILNCIKEKDVDTFKEMFSETAQNTDADLDKEIGNIIDYISIEDVNDIEIIDIGGVTEKEIDGLKFQKEYNYTLKMIIGGVTYNIKLGECLVDDFNSKNEGIYIFGITQLEEYYYLNLLLRKKEYGAFIIEGELQEELEKYDEELEKEREKQEEEFLKELEEF